jgi:uncharacterized protein YkwD
MIGNIVSVLIGFVALLGAGALSYMYLEDRFGYIVSIPSVQHITTEIPQTVVSKSFGAGAQSIVVTQPASIQKKTTATNTSVSAPIAITPQKAVVPGPLRVETLPVASVTSSTNVVLTAQGVFEYTNRARMEHGGLALLAHDETLDRIAMTKLIDMFEKQYFEHVSPTGIGPSELAKTAGYAYVVVGENLALGNFSSDSKLVDAWMMSPGHRANILNARYREIGIAAGRGMYEGRETWLAVQSFGMPFSACPIIDVQKKTQIDANHIAIAAMRMSLDTKKAQIDSVSINDQNYNIYVNEFNVMVPSYNALVETTRVLVDEYNMQVKAFNGCAAG